MRRLPFALRSSLPALLLLLLTAAIAVAYSHHHAQSRNAVQQRAAHDQLVLAEQLARVAEEAGPAAPQALAAELALAATDRRVAAVAALDSAGRILVAHRSRLDGLPASPDLLTGFDARRFAQAQATRQSLQWLDEGQRAVTALSFVQPATAGEAPRLREVARGVVWVVFDLQAELAAAQHLARAELVPVAMGVVLITVLLALLLRRYVTQPLQLIGRASQELAERGRLAQPVPEVGPLEIRSLAARFNDMARQTEQARDDIESARARLSSLVESAMDAIISVDGEMRIVMVNQAAKQMFRVDEAALLGQPIEVLLPERHRARHPEQMKRFAESGVTTRQMAARAVVHGRRWDGEEFPAEASISRSHIGETELMTVILRDVTERKRTEDHIHALNASLEGTVAERTATLRETAAELERERARLADLSAEISLILESATVGIVLLKDRRVLRCNRRIEELFGYAPGAAVGRSTRDWYPDDDAFEDAGRTLYARIDSDGTLARELQMARRDGTPFWARISARRFDHGVAGVTLAIIEDVTPEHQAAEALARAKGQADAANTAKSQFLANMSHEIRTPMNAIIGMTHLALRTALTEQQRDYLRKIQVSSQHLLGVINEILDFSKIEAGKLTLEHINFELMPVLDNVFTLIGERAEQKGLELVLDLDPEVPAFLVGDPLRLGQILINLCSNAVKFTEQGEVVLRVKPVAGPGHAAPDSAATRLRFEVCDTGIGLSPAQSAQLFASFHQADASTSRQYGGTGLGLAICKRLVQLMGGEIGVHSTPGRGATFWFELALAGGRAPAAAPRLPPLRGQRALAVEDNEAALDVLQRLLRSLGLNTDTARDGEQAWLRVRDAHEAGQPYDFVLLDWSMPRLNGIEAGRRILSLGLATPPRLLLVTGRGRDEVLREALDAGFSTVMVKPVNASLLHDNLLLSMAPPPDAATPALPGLRVSPSHLPTFAGRVLVVEDNEINQQIAREMLQDLGLTVTVAEHGQQALELLDQGPAFDLVFMDVHMPVMDGLSATRQLRSQARWADLPVVAMTANVMAEDRARCTQAGMNDFVPKPIEAEQLVAALGRWLAPPAPPAAEPARAVAVGNSPALAPLQGVHGLDLRAGLRRCSHKPELYLDLLRRFVEGQAESLDDLHQLGEALRRGDGLQLDTEALRLRVHSLKGVAGTIGATLLQARCEAAERKLQDDPLAAGEAIGAIEATTRALCRALRAALPATPPVAPPVAPVAPAADVGTLMRLLDAGDPDALPWMDTQGAALQGLLGARWKPLLAMVQRFEFSEALALLQEHTKEGFQ